MTDQIDRLEELAAQADGLLLAIGAYLAEYPDPIASNAAAMATHCSAGLRRAIGKIQERQERQDAKAERRAAYAAAPKREAYIEQLAKNAGRTYDEQLAVVEAARERYRKTDSRPLSEQLAKAPSMNPVKGEPT